MSPSVAEVSKLVMVRRGWTTWAWAWGSPCRALVVVVKHERSQLDDDRDAEIEADATKFDGDECGADHSLSEYDSSTVDVSVTSVWMLTWRWWENLSALPIISLLLLLLLLLPLPLALV